MSWKYELEFFFKNQVVTIMTITILFIEIGHHCCCFENLNWNVFSKIKLLLLLVVGIGAHCWSLELLHFVVPHQMRFLKNNWCRHECLVFDEDMIHYSVQVCQNITMFLLNLCFFLFFFSSTLFSLVNVQLNYIDPVHYIKK